MNICVISFITIECFLHTNPKLECQFKSKNIFDETGGTAQLSLQFFAKNFEVLLLKNHRQKLIQYICRR